MDSWVGGNKASARATPAQVEKVVHAIRHTPIVDNHAHPLLKPDFLGKHPLLSVTSEATGDALDDHRTSLAHLRAVKQLSGLLGCRPTWEDVVSAIEQKRIEEPEDWTAQCLEGIETILLDDGLDNEAEAYEYSWHDDYTRGKCKRIVRIETVAAAIIERLRVAGKSGPDVFGEIALDFDASIKDAVEDSEVVGFKSVICYRTGLDIGSGFSRDACVDALSAIMAQDSPFKRLQHKALNDYFVTRAAYIVSESDTRFKKPIQFHTGLGDNDIHLAKSSPSHMQDFIRAFPKVPIVLLHASYPFTREAGYLACVYSNVYTDVGEIFPSLSRDGQERAVRQVLELCPWSKVLWSTDGHSFPETYLLATMQIREVLESILCGYVRNGDLGWKAAIELVRDVLFRNSNKLYHLGLKFEEIEDLSPQMLVPDKYYSDVELLENFLKGRELPDFVRIYWNDFTASPRMRMVPFRKFMTLLDEGKSTAIGITKAALGMLQNSKLVPGITATGEYCLHPDFSSLKSGPIRGHVSMHGDFREKDGSKVDLCPRYLLERAVELGAENDLKFLLGFEIEFVLLQPATDIGPPNRYTLIENDGHAWSVSRAFADQRVSDLLRDMVGELADMGIYVEQLHAESGNGQFELVLPPLPPVEAVDALLHTREVMYALAANAGYKMTLHPKPNVNACGTASHAHISISSPKGSKREVYESFYAGILKHMRGLTAVTYSNPTSYQRVVDGAWAGGRWVAWGTQNRETPLRKIEDSHWEVKMLDGLANPYLAMGSILLAGTNGVVKKEKLLLQDCEVDPAVLTENDRKELHVTDMLPGSIEEALEALSGDADLVELLGEELVERYVAVKELETKLFGGMDIEQQWQWITERY